MAVALAGDIGTAKRTPARAIFPGLYGIRALAAFGILLEHTMSLTLAPDTPLSNPLRAPLVIFVVLSGFLNYRPWVVAHLRDEAPPETKTYVFRRMLRVFPLYWAVLVVYLVVRGFGPIGSAVDLAKVGLLLQTFDKRLVFSGVGPAWTLSVEFTFYLMLPLFSRGVRWVGRWLGATGPRGRLNAELIVVSIFWLIGPATRLGLGIGERYITDVPSCADMLATGMLLAVASAWVSEGNALPGSLARWFASRWSALAAVGVVMVMFMTISSPLPPLPPAPPYHSFFRIASALFLGATLIGISLFGPERHPVRRFLSTRPLQAMATLSFGIYLWHVLVIDELIDLIGGYAAVMLVPVTFCTVVFAVLLALVTYFGIQLPLESLRTRLQFSPAPERSARRAAKRSTSSTAAASTAAASAAAASAAPASTAPASSARPRRSPVALPQGATDMLPLAGYRAVAATIVVLGHVMLAARMEQDHAWVSPFHSLAVVVPVFFGLAGYVSYRPFATANLTGAPPPSAGRFIWKRIVRIYFLYLLALTIYLLAVPFFRPDSARGYLQLYTLTQVYDPALLQKGLPAAWFEAALFPLYMLMPAFAFLARSVANRNGPSSLRQRVQAEVFLCATIVVVAVVCRTALIAAQVEGSTTWPIAYADFVAVGMLAAVASVWVKGGGRLPAFVDRWRRHPNVALAVLISVGLAIEWVNPPVNGPFTLNMQLFRFSAYLAMVALVVVAAVLSGPRYWLNRWMATFPMVVLGLGSYSTYLWHQLVLVAIAFQFGSTVDRSLLWPFMFAGVILSHTVGLISAIFLEGGLERLKDVSFKRRAPQSGPRRGVPVPAGAAGAAPPRRPPRPVSAR
ncbi:MAG: acyltransferase 3 [Acidimicrobiales bacterium]|nr:acyltransferase 3 [Acidimicrobiales bacterium]